MPKKLKPEDEALWEAMTRDVAPIKRSKPPSPHSIPKKPVARPAAAMNAEADYDRPPPPRSATPQSLNALDGARARRLKRGALPIDARLDLHGLTQDKAYRILNRFLARAQDEGKRVILVITGKGGTPKQDPDNVFKETRTGILRHAVPEWLADGDNAGRVVAWHPAHQRHGGDGALYVVLRRLR